MLNIKLAGLIAEPDSKKTIDEGKGWMVSRALQLIDNEAATHIAEWFYVAACNQYYFEHEAVKDNQGRGYYIQDSFDEMKLLEAVKDVFNELSFDDWDDFFKKMQLIAEYEDVETQ